MYVYKYGFKTMCTRVVCILWESQHLSLEVVTFQVVYVHTKRLKNLNKNIQYLHFYKLPPKFKYYNKLWEKPLLSLLFPNSTSQSGTFLERCTNLPIVLNSANLVLRVVLGTIAEVLLQYIMKWAIYRLYISLWVDYLRKFTGRWAAPSSWEIWNILEWCHPYGRWFCKFASSMIVQSPFQR